ncbi:alpha-L-rhamnosidase [Portibacter marinus]|uniref:alpha-L-rhamnosidase n=1 Tax=Portibacter marinus TaxID=2898660 RepID=UPI001F3B43AD|nr:alpha-L-rhamnosidase [Portibacter marinus]
MKFVFTFVCALVVNLTLAQLQAVDLVCEYKKNPVGIDVKEPRLSWKIQSDQENIIQSAYEIRIADNKEALTRPGSSLGKVESSESVNVVCSAPELNSRDRKYWQVRVWDKTDNTSEWSEVAFFEMGLLQPEAWTADWISMEGEEKIDGSRPSIYLRKDFNTDRKVKSARLYASAMGLYELYINGEKVGDQLFTPGWTSYNHHTQYQVYDVTDMLKGTNTIAGVLGDGWYRGFIGWQDQNDYYGKRRALLAQLEIIYEDDSMEVINSDGTWSVSNGPILKSDIYNGEWFDFGHSIEGWSKPDFQEDWNHAEVIDSSKEHLVASSGVPVKAIEELKPVNTFITPKGEKVLDMGQNMVGWVKMKVKGNAGDTIRLKFAEVLDSDGNFYTDNLRAAEATDIIILSSDDEVVYEPTFTFHGFRYVQVIGFEGSLNPKHFTGVVIHSAMEPALEFSCSDKMINQLQHNIKWGQKGNFLDVPTDCPQRDERMGWTGDAQVFAKTAAYNFDVAAFYTKWMKDFEADQKDNGVIPHVIPDVLKGRGGATGWADAVIIIPWTNYVIYGDERILESSYEEMKQWVEYMKSRAGENHIWSGDQHFGDWLAFATTRSDYPGATTEKDLIATAYYSYSSGLLGKIAHVLGKEQDALYFTDLSDSVKEAFNQEFVTPNGRLVSHTQTAYALALAFDLLPEVLAEKAGRYLAEDVSKFGHLTTGFLGTPLLCQTLCNVGREDLAFMLLNRKEYPSWLYPITQGATTIWERWDGQKPDGSFQNVGMNSFNHYAYGAIGEWLYEYVAGLKSDPKQPGFKHFYLSPHPGGGLTEVRLAYQSIRGEIKSQWKIADQTIQYSVQIPANTSATIHIPTETSIETMLSHSLKENSETVYEVGSGKYSFTWRMDAN